MKVLVTGSTGFIGAHLCKALVTEGHKVHAFHRPNSPLLALGELPVAHVLGDITQPATLQEAFAGIQVVFHAAAHVGKRDPRLIYQTTVEGTRNVAEAALRAGVHRLIHTSSVAALGVPVEQDQSRAWPPLPMNENHTWNYPASWWPYGYHKYLAELEVQKAVAQGLDAVIVNPALVVGPADLNRIAGDVLIRVATAQIPAAIEGGLNVIHIDDVVRGHRAALEHGLTGQRYILGNENLSHQRFLELIARAAEVRAPRWVLPSWLARGLRLPISAIGKILPIPLAGQALHRVGYYFYYDTSKATNLLHLQNLIPVQQAVQQAINWYKEQGILS
jgi:dihydroflavonol-4-reductase